MINNRQSFRLRKQVDVHWSVPEQKIEGEGIIFNISLTGMLFVTDKLFEPEHELSLSFSLKDVPCFPRQGRLKWFRKAGKDNAQYQCGVRFPSEAAQNRAWIQWMEDNITKLADAADNKILDRYLSGEPQE